MRGELTICIPWVPDQQCNPNNHRCSERTKIRHRKQGAEAAGYPLKVISNAVIADGADYVFGGPVLLDIEVRWGYRQRSWDSDNLVTAYKYVRDALEAHQIVTNDRNVRIGVIAQVRATGQPETILRLRREPR